MKKITLTTYFLGFACLLFGQENVGQKIEELTTRWDSEAETLSSYEGLSRFCADQNYRGEMIETLNGIHHYDSVLYKTIEKKARFGGDAEMKKTLKDIEKIESTVSIKDFLRFLNEECGARNAIEKNAKKTGEDADGEIYVLETELQRYVKQITKKIDLVREHVHHLGMP